jgi:hypothetical protein
MGEGASTRAQEVEKEATPESPTEQVGSAVRGGSQVEEMMTCGPDVVEVEMVSISFGEPSNLAEVTQPSRTRRHAALAW